VRCARLAREAGYDGVEVMGGEGYLINQFLAPLTNFRTDEWGGDAAGRSRFALRIVQGIRAAVPENFVISFRLSLMDLVEHGSHWKEVLDLARQLEAAGVDLFNTSVGWHEARIPTIAMMVPRAAFSWAAEQLKQAVSVPVAASNRINTPEVADDLIAQGHADMVAMARPFLADPAFVRKAQAGQSSAINTCIACNQSCLDRIFTRQQVSCLVNPRACREWEWPQEKAAAPRKIAVLGAGPAGLACAREAADRGHKVTLFEPGIRIGGQFFLAQKVPGKQELGETLRYFEHEIQRLGIELRLNTTPDIDTLSGFDHVVVATGVTPRRSGIEGENSSKVVDYIEALRSPALSANAWPSWARGRWALTWPSCWPITRPTTAAWPPLTANGASIPSASCAAASRPARKPIRRVRSGCFSAARRPWAAPANHHGLDSPRPAQEQKRTHVQRRGVHPHRRQRPAPAHTRRAALPERGQHRGLRRPGIT
jgi:2,4-dienoyl-CoA reductase (NADPH2)